MNRKVQAMLRNIFMTLWNQKHCFNAKRPFGNSFWEYEIYAELMRSGQVDGRFDENGDIDTVDKKAADDLVRDMINSIWREESKE